MCIIAKIRKLIHTSCKKSKDTSLPKEPYKDGRYFVSYHGVKRMNEREITKGEVHINLHTTPIKKTKVKYDKLNRPLYERFSFNKINTRINPKIKKVCTVSRYHSKYYDKIIKK